MTTLARRRRPGLHFLLSHPAHFLALGFGTGLAPRGPGTAGTLLAFPLYWLLAPALDAGPFLLLLTALAVAGVAVCQRTAQDLGVEDPSCVVWDEVVAFLGVLFFTPPGLAWQLAAFALFRFFDIAKPGPVRWAEMRWRGGLGVMADDLVAGLLALVVLALARRALTHWGGI